MATEYITTGVIRKGKLKIRRSEVFLSQLAHMKDGEVFITVERARAHRSLEANAYMWGVVLHEIAKHTGHDEKDLHAFFKGQFLTKPLILVNAHGEIIGEHEIPGSTRKLNTVTFYEYVEKIRLFAAEELGCTTPDPDPNYASQ